MATINDIVNLDSRRGDVAAGGGDAGAFNVDTQPLSTLSLYTNSYNQVLYNQTIQDRNEKIKQIAEVAKIDVNNLYGKDKDYLVKKLNNLRDFATQYAKNPNLTIDGQLRWQTALSDVNNDYQSGKQRAVTYHAQLDELNKSHSGQEKEILLKELNDKMENTDISTPISAGTGYKPVAVNLPKPIQSEYQMSYNDGNMVTTANVGVLVPKWNMPLATATVMGLSSLTKGLSGTEAELQSTANGEAQHWAAMTEPVNAALQEKDANGNYKYFDKDASGEYQFNYDKFKAAKSSDLVVMPAIDAIMNASQYSIQKKNEVTQGVFTDKNITYQAPSNLKPSDFDLGIINISPDGVTANQLAFGGLYQKYEGDKITKTFKETGLAIDQQKANAQSSNAALGWKKLDLDKEKWKATQTAGTEDMKSSALAKAQRIYDELKNLADSNGVISPDKVRQLNAEQLKYLGGVKSTKDALGKITTGYSPLDASGQTAIELKNGQIKVMRPANNGTSIGRTVTGGYSGQFDNESSTNITNVATNILNEQLKNAGSKELSSYAPIDYATNTDAGGTQQSSTATQTKGLADPTLDTNVNNWKALGNGNYQYIDGSIYNSKGKKIK